MNLIHSLFWKFCSTTKSVSKGWRMRINNIFLPLWLSFIPWSKFKGTYEGQIKLIGSHFIIKHSNCSIWKRISLSIHKTGDAYCHYRLLLKCSGYYYCQSSFNEVWASIMHEFKSYSYCIGVYGGGRPWSWLEIRQHFRRSLSKRLFPDALKRANITSVHKKNDPLDKENYRPVSILLLLSKN